MTYFTSREISRNSSVPALTSISNSAISVELSLAPSDTMRRSATSLFDAARELDANGTNFGYNPRTGYTRG